MLSDTVLVLETSTELEFPTKEKLKKSTKKFFTPLNKKMKIYNKAPIINVLFTKRHYGKEADF